MGTCSLVDQRGKVLSTTLESCGDMFVITASIFSHVADRSIWSVEYCNRALVDRRDRWVLVCGIKWIGLASSIVFAALCFLSVRFWNCLMKNIKPQTAVGERAHDQPLPAGDAAAHANGVPDLEMGNGHGPAEGGHSMAVPELKMGIVNGGGGIEHCSDQQAHTPVIESPHTITRDAARGALDRWACRSLKGTSSFPAKPRKRLLNEAPTGRGRLSTYAGHDCSGSMNSVELKPPFGRSASLSSPVGEVVDDSAAPLTLINPPAG